MSEPLELWTDFKLGPNEWTSQFCRVSMNPLHGKIHLIEKSAYDALKAQLAAKDEQIKMLTEAVERITVQTKYCLNGGHATPLDTLSAINNGADEALAKMKT